MLENATSLRKSAPTPPNISFQIPFKCPTLAIIFGHVRKPSRFAHLLTRCTIPCACHAKGYLNAQKCSVPVSFLQFWLRNVLRATTACTFSTSQLPKVVRTWCALYIWLRNVLRPSTFFDIQLPKAVRTCGVFYIFTSKCALRHNDVQFLISHLASWLRRFSEPIFRPSGATNHWKKQCFATFPYLFVHLDLLSSEIFSFLIFFLLLFSSLSFPSLLFICPYCRKFAKLPSTTTATTNNYYRYSYTTPTAT